MKHSRLLTCYSALLYLLAIYVANKMVPQGDAISMTQLSPTARLEWLLGRRDLKSAHQTVRDLLDCYERFLAATDYSPDELTARFLDPAKSEQYSLSANRLGDLAFKAIETIGQRSDFHRVLVV